MNIYRLHYILHEPVFFASRELGAQYLTEAVLGNYAQAYALGWAASPWRLEAGAPPRYQEDLGSLQNYVTPARPEGPILMRTERFNAQGEGFRSRMDQGAVVDDLDILMEEGAKGRALNRPQQGVIRFLARGNNFISYAFSEKPIEFPKWIRMGKTMAKTSLSANRLTIKGNETGNYSCAALLNPADLPTGTKAKRFDLIGVRPIPLLRNAVLDGPYFLTEDGFLPNGLHWRFV